MALPQIFLIVGACLIQQVTVLTADRLLRWNFMKRQLASGLLGFLFSILFAVTWGSDSLWIPVGFSIFWTWQLFIVSVMEKSLSLRVLCLISGDTPSATGQLLEAEILRQFRQRADMLVLKGYAESVGSSFQRGSAANSRAAKIDGLGMKIFDVKIGNLY